VRHAAAVVAVIRWKEGGRGEKIGGKAGERISKKVRGRREGEREEGTYLLLLL